MILHRPGDHPPQRKAIFSGGFQCVFQSKASVGLLKVDSKRLVGQFDGCTFRFKSSKIEKFGEKQYHILKEKCAYI